MKFANCPPCSRSPPLRRPSLCPIPARRYRNQIQNRKIVPFYAQSSESKLAVPKCVKIDKECRIDITNNFHFSFFLTYQRGESTRNEETIIHISNSNRQRWLTVQAQTQYVVADTAALNTFSQSIASQPLPGLAGAQVILKKIVLVKITCDL